MDIKIIGHRGNQGFARENSLEALLNCSTNDSIDGTELDIRPTRDNQIVISHDATLANNARICNLTLEEIIKLKEKTPRVDVLLQVLYNCLEKDKYFLKRYLSLSKESSNIPLLTSILENFKSDKHLLIEIKKCAGEYDRKQSQIFETKIIDLLCQYFYKDIVLESYNYNFLLRIKERYPHAKIIALVNKNGININNISRDFDGVSLEFPLVTPQNVENIMLRGQKLYSWDDKKPIKHYENTNKIIDIYGRSIENGELDFTMITDFPEKARQYVLK